MSRPTWDEHFIGLALYIGQSRATCDRGKCGAVAVIDNRSIATGYVGAPSGLPHCDEVGHLISVIDGKERCVRTVHAEQNLLVNSAITGIPLVGSTVYSTMEPCITCAMLLTSVGVNRVVANYKYHAAEQSRLIFEQSGVLLEILEDEVMQYPGFVGMLRSGIGNLAETSKDYRR